MGEYSPSPKQSHILDQATILTQGTLASLISSKALTELLHLSAAQAFAPQWIFSSGCATDCMQHSAVWLMASTFAMSVFQTKSSVSHPLKTLLAEPRGSGQNHSSIITSGSCIRNTLQKKLYNQTAIYINDRCGVS